MKEVIRFSKESTVFLFDSLFVKLKFSKNATYLRIGTGSFNCPVLIFHFSDSLETYRADLAAHMASIYGVSSKSKNFYKLIEFLFLNF